MATEKNNIDQKNIAQHNTEIARNLEYWNKKPVLRQVYRGFHELINQQRARLPEGKVVELGSGIGNIQDVIPECIRTDIFENETVDQVENAYRLSFEDEEVSDLVLFDVFHHLQYPGEALAEFQRVLLPGGRVILFEPYGTSLLGRLVFGMLHHEPLGLGETIEWQAPEGWDPASMDYYAAQANAARIFCGGEGEGHFSGWRILSVNRLSAISYVLSGGYSKPQMYPDFLYPFMLVIDRVANLLPALSATRLLVVLEKA